jgi:lysozyme
MTDWLELCIPLVQRFEGCRLDAYQDAVGVWTIGWGSTGPNVREGVTWTQVQADDDLSRRLRFEFAPGVLKALHRPYTPAQLAAMVSLAYNIGVTAFAGSTLVRLFNLGDTVGAESQFSRWNKACGKVLQGLVSRRAAEAALFAS